MHVAAGTAFARSRGRPPADGAEVGGTRQRIHPWALAFVFGFPAIGGMLTVVAVLSRSGTSDDGAFPLAVGFVGLAGILLVLGLWSRLDVRDDDLMVRFFGFRSTTVRFAELQSATFGMSFPSISYAITLTDRDGRKALVHANWWRDERSIMRPVCRVILKHDVPMDRTTARIVAQVLRVKRPKAEIIHHGLLNKDRTW